MEPSDDDPVCGCAVGRKKREGDCVVMKSKGRRRENVVVVEGEDVCAVRECMNRDESVIGVQQRDSKEPLASARAE